VWKIVPALEIPKKYERGFVVIKSLSDSDIKQVVEVLGAASPASEFSDILPSLLPRLPEVPEGDVQKFLETLYSLYSYRSHLDAPIDEFVGDLSEAIRESENEEVQTSNPDQLALLENRLKSLLTVPSLSMRSKARALRTDFANIFLDAKIISDIRPVWDGDVKELPGGAVITQTLKLEYSHAGGTGELYLYLDKEDIELLVSALTRAKQKVATLESLAQRSSMKILDG